MSLSRFFQLRMVPCSSHLTTCLIGTRKLISSSSSTRSFLSSRKMRIFKFLMHVSSLTSYHVLLYSYSMSLTCCHSQVRNFELTEVSKTEFMTPSAFIFLYENQLFLTFRNRTVAVWNFRGELVTSFEDHLLWHPDCNTNNIYITSDQDLIISYCKADSDDPLCEGNGNIF